MREITIFAVTAGDIIHHWQIVEPLLESSMPCEIRRYWPIDILAQIIQGKQQAWLVREGREILAVIVTQIDQFPRRRGLTVFFLAGTRMVEWFDRAETIITEYASRMGCDHFQTSGRRGWERVIGIEPTTNFYTKDIIPEKPLNGASSTMEAPI